MAQKFFNIITILLFSSCVAGGNNGVNDINVSICAELRDSHECFKEAERYFFGFSREEDKEFAINIYQQAAQMGSPFAKARLGSLYLLGWGVAKDWAASASFFEDVLPQTDDLKGTRWEPVILAALGLIYQEGPSELRNETKSFKYLLQAAKLRYGPAQIKVAAAYGRGHGINVDELEAYAWLRAAYEGGYTMIGPAIEEIENQIDGEIKELANDLAKKRIEKYRAIPMQDIWKQPLKEI